MHDRKVALRYAQALLLVAAARSLVDDLDASLRGIAEILKRHRELRLFLKNPQVARAQKKELLGSLLGERIEPVLFQFLELLIDKGRVAHLNDIQVTFAELAQQHRGQQRALVVTAVPLCDDLQERLAHKLAALVGRSIDIEKKVDPSVLGGVCVIMGDRVLDGTLRTSLKRLREVLEKAPLRAF